MTTILEDRRRKRSNDPLIALHYQLAQARHESSVEAVVLADGSGVVVAGAGAWAVCEELAAYAPLLAGDPMDETRSAGRVARMHGEVDVRPMHVDGVEVYLAARGHRSATTTMLGRLAAGISRILDSTQRVPCATPA
jgi:hypothetical protein